MLEDKLLLKVAEEIDNRFTRIQYENLLVELGLYSLSNLKDNEEYYKRTKRNLILDTLRLADDPVLIIRAAHKKRRLSNEVIALLEIGDGVYKNENVTVDLSPNSIQQARNDQKAPEYKKQRPHQVNRENLVSKAAREELPVEGNTGMADNTGVFFIVIPIVVVLISLIFLAMRIWDWTVALGVSALVIAAFAYINDLLKPKIDQVTARRGIQKNAVSIFLILAVMFFIALIISLRRSTNDLNKQIIELGRNYNDAVSTLSGQQNLIDQGQLKINEQATQINDLQSIQLAQSNYIARLEGTATQATNQIQSLKSTVAAIVPLRCSDNLLSEPWHIEATNDAAEDWLDFEDQYILRGKDFLRVTYNLHGLVAQEGELKNDSTIVFTQPNWYGASLFSYGQNGLDGYQTVNIPLSDFLELPNPDQSISGGKQLDRNDPVSSIRVRFWHRDHFVVDITSIAVCSVQS